MTNAFADLGLSAPIVKALADLGYEEPTPIQKAAIPLLLAGRDVLGQAATGTGKTAAFGLPLVERYVAGHAAGVPCVLVLTPTRELCLQVCESFLGFGKDVGIEVAPIYGGQEYGRQIRLLKRGVHVVVATPGRALDHLRRGTLNLSGIKALVLDEADEMLDMGFADELEAILAELPEEHQTALFSATLPTRIQSIAEAHLKDPEHIVIARSATQGEAPRIPQTAYVVGRPYRLAALGRILDVESPELAICFARTRIEVDEITEALRSRGFTVEALHGGLDQASRDRVMRRARTGQLELIVATDVAARGIDLENVSHVINFGLPASLETYVHRIGRTGRAGRTGKAITVMEPREYGRLRAVERLTHAKVEIKSVPSITDVRAKRLELTRAAVAEELSGEDYERFRVVVEQLCEEFDPFDVAAAAIALVDKFSGGAADEDEIPPAATGFDRRRGTSRDEARGDRAPREGRFGAQRGERVRRPPEPGMTRLFIGAGRSLGIRPGDIVGAIANEADIPARRIGAIDIAEHFTLVEVASDIAHDVIDALRGTTIKGRSVNVRLDREANRGPRQRGAADNAAADNNADAESTDAFDDESFEDDDLSAQQDPDAWREADYHDRDKRSGRRGEGREGRGNARFANRRAPRRSRFEERFDAFDDKDSDQ